MPKILLNQKDPSDTIQQVFDFASWVTGTDSLASAVTTCTVYSGVDGSPSAIISGTTTVSGTKATQAMVGGINGVTYTIACKGTMASGTVITLSGYLTVLQTLL